MNLVAIEYHDIVPDGDLNSSGFDMAGANLYKVEESTFRTHLSEFAARSIEFSSLGDRIAQNNARFLTFDDGGVGGAIHAVPLLEEFGVSGCFLVTTGMIGRDRFLTARQIRELDSAGHCIGSHTETHPLRMAALSRMQLDQEWRVSTDKLAQITGRATRVASIAGGQYSKAIAELADKNGIQVLLTSEPTIRCFRIGECLVVGRFTIKRFDRAKYVADILLGKGFLRQKQWIAWNGKKVLKRLVGSKYTHVREKLLLRHRK